jgi:fumarate reductase subunit C
MSARYTEFHPRWYRPRMSVFWWVGRRSYLIFVLRELTSVFVAWSVVFLLLLFHALTWFNLAPQAMVVRLRGKRVPRSRVAGAHYAGWALLSALAAWLILG